MRVEQVLNFQPVAQVRPVDGEAARLDLPIRQRRGRSLRQESVARARYADFAAIRQLDVNAVIRKPHAHRGDLGPIKKAHATSPTRVICIIIQFFPVTPITKLPITQFPARRHVHDNLLISTDLPPLRIRVDPALVYIGVSEFLIKGLARAERHHFVEAAAGRVRRMLVAQFEGFLPDNTRTYNYALANPMRLGTLTFGHQIQGYRVAAEMAVPEVQHTAQLLAERGYAADDEQMVSRFDAIVGDDRRHELLLFYHENIRDAGHTLDEVFENTELRPAFDEVGQALKARSLAAFTLEAWPDGEKGTAKR